MSTVPRNTSQSHRARDFFQSLFWTLFTPGYQCGRTSAHQNCHWSVNYPKYKLYTLRKLPFFLFTELASAAQKTVFLTEGTQMAGLQHRHILTALACCMESNNIPIIVYPWVSRGNLKRSVRN